MAIALVAGNIGILPAQRRANELQRDPVVDAVLDMKARPRERNAAHDRRVRIENLLKAYPGARQVEKEEDQNQLIEEIKKSNGKGLLLELTRQENELEKPAIDALADAQPEREDVQIVRETLLSLLFRARSGETATRLAVAVIRQAQESYLWRGVDSSVDTEQLAHAIVRAIRTNTSSSWVDSMMPKLYEEAKARRRNPFDAREALFFDTALDDLKDFGPKEPSKEQETQEAGKVRPTTGVEKKKERNAEAGNKQSTSDEGRTLGSIVMWVVFALIIAAAGAWAVTSLINPDSPSAAELERPPDSQVAASKEITGSLPTLCELPPEALLGKRALVHVDLDILDGLGNLTSSADHQIDKVVRTVQYLRDRRAKVVLMSQLQRSGWNIAEPLSMSSMNRILPLLKSKLHTVPLTLTRIGQAAEDAVKTMQDGEVVLLENLGRHPHEAGDARSKQALAEDLRTLGDLYVNDAPYASRFEYASVVDIVRAMPLSVAGLALEEALLLRGRRQRSALLQLPGVRILIEAAAKHTAKPFAEKV